METRSVLESMVKTTAQRHKLASALLAWFHDDDMSHLHRIAQASGFDVSTQNSFQTWTRGPGVTFHLVLLEDPGNPKELADAITESHAKGLLPLLIVQYSNDPTDKRGDNVFDMAHPEVL